MLFVKNLKKQYTPEEFIEILKQEKWTGGEFKIVTPKQTIGILNQGYIIFKDYEDTRFAVAITCYNAKLGKVNCVKATVTDVTNLEEQLADNVVHNAVHRIGGNIGSIVMGAASGEYAKAGKAKKLAEVTNKELLAFIKKYNL